MSSLDRAGGQAWLDRGGDLRHCLPLAGGSQPGVPGEIINMLAADLSDWVKETGVKLKPSLAGIQKHKNTSEIYINIGTPQTLRNTH